jgi:hypothetical protein
MSFISPSTVEINIADLPYDASGKSEILGASDLKPYFEVSSNPDMYEFCPPFQCINYPINVNVKSGD